MRAIHNGPRTQIEQMYTENLGLYAKDTRAFNKFRSQIINYAQKLKLQAIIYDEVLLFKKLEGTFLHHPFETNVSCELTGSQSKHFN